ncbi:methylated-DNA--[protein]-cysteine S-methyltransferase [Neisseria sp. Dent CA1/247]|uniref:methylated-DNA--[protein]-cysteine S-methyltransferase n=1 Tax=Neisseria sp. Dent CA1/247 TaxID=2912675 RepID=UPI001FD26ED1|nr:methylated-DNA--[protein]-cysteine S-methyltransferase [Neisseria sp. Dent CA1/247]UOO76322.1 methylated-DNA--[protein]-cysteine S-methyltransferase [Neisseria sp. Dent CA1/247]
MNYPCLYSAPFGDITLIFDAEENLVEVNLHGRPEYAPYPLPEAWKNKLDDYFSGRLKNFHHPISTQGTAFQQKVWQAIAEIPAGEVLTYQDIARKIGSHPRAVGGACGKNPLALVVPCHRVVAKQGLGGFSSGEGDALAIKRWLLQHEGVEINSK